MFSAILVCAACATLDPSEAVAGPRVEPETMAAYEAARARAGRDADAHVRLALWCEAHGLEAERLKHLAIAVLTDPTHAAARGLLGLVAYRGGWHSPEAVSAQIGPTRRCGGPRLVQCPPRPHGQLRRRPLEAGAVVRATGARSPRRPRTSTRVVQLEPGPRGRLEAPGLPQAGPALGHRRAARRREGRGRGAEGGRPALAAAPVPVAGWIGDKARELELVEALATVTDPRAVPSVWAMFGRGKASHQKVAVQLLGQIDSPDATRALALLALDGKSPEVRARATQTLRVRDPRDIASLLVAMLRDPELDADPILFHYSAQTGRLGRDRLAGCALRSAAPTTTSSGLTPSTRAGHMSAMVGPSLRWTASRCGSIISASDSSDLMALIDQIRNESADEILVALGAVRHVDQSNARVIQTLSATTGQDLGKDREAWRKWWTEERGYAYEPPRAGRDRTSRLDESKPTYYDNVHSPASPPARRSGRSPVPGRSSRSQVGDQVLTQDLRTGALSYQPGRRRPRTTSPTELCRIDLGRDAIKATGIHRFWKAGQGWVMARDLKPGDVVRATGRRRDREVGRAGRRRAGLQPQGPGGRELLRRRERPAGPRQQRGPARDQALRPRGGPGSIRALERRIDGSLTRWPHRSDTNPTVPRVLRTAPSPAPRTGRSGPAPRRG